jgi:hypothetical protein
MWFSTDTPVSSTNKIDHQSLIMRVKVSNFGINSEMIAIK